MPLFKQALVFALIFALACAEIETEVAKERGDIEYRVSFKTRDVEPAGATFTEAEEDQRKSFTSTGKFTIEIIGKDGTTGPQPLIDHPSQTQKESGGWEVTPGMIQVAKITAPDVGEVTEIKLNGDNDDKWAVAWLKLNTNDFHSGLGNGIYYTVVSQGVDSSNPAVAKVTIAENEENVDELHQCQATFCKKAEHRYLQEGEDYDDEDNEEHQRFQDKIDNSAEHIKKYGARFGPLGEGLPGTHLEPSMTHGHFMREFFMMEHVDEDDEDFLRTHTV